jgi:hypothetical protein
MVFWPTPRIAKDAALKPVMVDAEKFGTKLASSPMLRGLACSIVCESIALTATGVA